MPHSFYCRINILNLDDADIGQQHAETNTTALEELWMYIDLPPFGQSYKILFIQKKIESHGSLGILKMPTFNIVLLAGDHCGPEVKLTPQLRY